MDYLCKNGANCSRQGNSPGAYVRNIVPVGISGGKQATGLGVLLKTPDNKKSLVANVVTHTEAFQEGGGGGVK